MSAGPIVPIPQRLSLITLGVEDVERARAFYERLGFKASDFDSKLVAFFEMTNGVVLGLFGAASLAEDANVASDGSGFHAVACSINVASEAEVDEAMAFAERCGARITKPAKKVFWGGYSGYFADPDGHLWEIAYNPFWQIDTQGRSLLPSTQPKASA